MNLNWLKRLALKWPINDEHFYHLMGAIRGMDNHSDMHRSKHHFTAPFRAVIGANRNCPGARVEGGVITMVDTLNEHFTFHQEQAVRALHLAGYTNFKVDNKPHYLLPQYSP